MTHRQGNNITHRKRRWGRGTSTPLAIATSIVLVLGFIASTTQAVAQDDGPGGDGNGDQAATVDPQVREEVADENTTTFWVYLRDRADLQRAAAQTNRKEQGRQVVDELTETAQASQARLKRMLRDDGAEYESFWIANAVHVTGDAELVDRIANLPEVEEIAADKVYELPDPEPTAEQAQVDSMEWNIDRVNAPAAWSEYAATGEGIVIGSIDSGAMFDHPALANSYRGNNGDGTFSHDYSWWDPSQICGSPSLEPCDNHGHGTHTVGTMVGDDGADNVIGVAPGARWISAKGCEVNRCSDAALLSAGQFMLSPTDLNGANPNPDLRPHVVNNSWGGGATTDPWYQQTVQAWLAAGIFPQFANGNPGPACGAAGNPGNLPGAYSAGAFDVNGDIADFSGRGPSAWGSDVIKPNIAAPGVAIRSALPDGSYAAWNGTSMASPHVAGAVALLWSAAPSLAGDIDATRAVLDGSALDAEDLSCGGTAGNNNVFGQGKLDILAALDQAPTGPKGTLAGTVTDADTGDPMPGLTVTVGDDAQRTRVTGDDGGYVFENVPAGDYPVAVWTYGYVGQDVTVTVTADETTTQDFALEPADVVTVSGRVTDGDAHGWPLPAEITVDGSPVSTNSDPATGEYEFEVPVGATYELTVEPEYPGYGEATVNVDADEGDVTVDVALPVTQCLAAPGYHVAARIGILGEFTGNGETPLQTFLAGHGIASEEITWGDDVTQYDTIVVNKFEERVPDETFLDFLEATDAAGVGVVFLDNDYMGYSRPTGIGLLYRHLGNPAERDWDGHTSIPYVSYEVTQAHPVLDGFEVGDEVIIDDPAGPRYARHAWFGGYEGEGRTVIADASNGRDGVVGSGVGVQQRENNRHVLLSSHLAYISTGPQYWHEDAVRVFLNALEWSGEISVVCQPIEGGLVLGTVSDMNTGKPVARATVSGVDVPTDTGTSAKDGAYWLFSSVTGERNIVASRRNFSEDHTTVDVVADAVTRADFTLEAGRLSIEPADVTSTVPLGGDDEQTVTITNTGSAPAMVELGGEQRASFAALDGAVTPQEVAGNDNEVREIRGEFSPAFIEPANETKVAEDEQTLSPEEEAVASPWERVPDLPTRISGNSAAAVDGVVYSFGGIWGFSAQHATHAYDPETGAWTRRADIPNGLQVAGATAVDGKVYAVGGFGRHVDTNVLGYQHSLFAYDPETDTWSRGADMPDGRAAPGTAELDGQLYVVGGCMGEEQATGHGTACNSTDTAWRYDPATDQWRVLADYPEKTAWLACAGTDGRLHCSGGIDGAAISDRTYIYDPPSDTWAAAADLLYDNWGMSYTRSESRLVVSGGVTDGGNAITNRGAAYDPTTDSWTAIEPSNLVTYRSASACGFYKLAGWTLLRNPQSYTEWSDRHPGLGDCSGTSDAPWLTAEASGMTLAPGEEVTVTVSMDSVAAEEQYPGTYTSGLWFGHDTPYPMDAVGVTFEVEPPSNWGTISGTVTSVSCEGDEAPIDGATVHLTGRETDLTFVTGEDGSYTYWLPPGPKVTVATSRDGYRPHVKDVVVRPRRTVDTSATLNARCAAGAGSPSGTP